MKITGVLCWFGLHRWVRVCGLEKIGDTLGGIHECVFCGKYKGDSGRLYIKEEAGR
jgi:hypothetical protein